MLLRRRLALLLPLLGKLLVPLSLELLLVGVHVRLASRPLACWTILSGHAGHGLSLAQIGCRLELSLRNAREAISSAREADPEALLGEGFLLEAELVVVLPSEVAVEQGFVLPDGSAFVQLQGPGEGLLVVARRNLGGRTVVSELAQCLRHAAGVEPRYAAAEGSFPLLVLQAGASCVLCRLRRNSNDLG